MAFQNRRQKNHQSPGNLPCNIAPLNLLILQAKQVATDAAQNTNNRNYEHYKELYDSGMDAIVELESFIIKYNSDKVFAAFVHKRAWGQHNNGGILVKKNDKEDTVDIYRPTMPLQRARFTVLLSNIAARVFLLRMNKKLHDVILDHDISVLKELYTKLITICSEWTNIAKAAQKALVPHEIDTQPQIEPQNDPQNGILSQIDIHGGIYLSPELVRKLLEASHKQLVVAS